MASSKLTSSLQESILTLLCFSNERGGIAAALLQSNYFEQPYADIAKSVLDFRKRFKKPPGEAHIDDIFDFVLNAKDARKAEIYRQILAGMMDQAGNLNEEYVLSRVNEFVDKQTITNALVSASERLMQGREEEGALTEVRNIMFDALKAKSGSLSTGVFLNDLENVNQVLKLGEQSYPTGIPALDARNIGLTPKEMMLFIAPKGMGKSWMMIHLGRHALLKRANVVHISLEMGIYQVVTRYYQSFFGISKRAGEIETTKIKLDSRGRFANLDFNKVRPAAALNSENIAGFLRKQIGRWGNRIGNLVVQQFPTDGLKIGALAAYLDSLELSGFIPHVLLVDYPDLMALDQRQEFRISLGKVYKELRGLAVERNLALGVPTQTGRKGLEARTVSSGNVSEDFSKNQTADIVLTYSQTPKEKRSRIARLLVAHARNDEDRFSVLITQQYAIGQFAMSSHRLVEHTAEYFERLDEIVGSKELGSEEPLEDDTEASD